MGIIGEKFKNNEVFVPEVLIAARAMNGGVEVLKPHLVEAGVETKGVKGKDYNRRRAGNRSLLQEVKKRIAALL